MSNNYKGPPEDFAMVVPVPVVLKKEQVKTLATDVFRRVDQLSAPRLVEYWEQDPRVPPPMPPPAPGAMYAPMPTAVPSESSAGRFGGDHRSQVRGGRVPDPDPFGEGVRGGLAASVEITSQSGRLGEPGTGYIREQMKFFVAKVDIKKVHRDKSGFSRAVAAALFVDAP